MSSICFLQKFVFFCLPANAWPSGKGILQFSSLILTFRHLNRITNIQTYRKIHQKEQFTLCVDKLRKCDKARSEVAQKNWPAVPNSNRPKGIRNQNGQVSTWTKKGPLRTNCNFSTYYNPQLINEF